MSTICKSLTDIDFNFKEWLPSLIFQYKMPIQNFPLCGPKILEAFDQIAPYSFRGVEPDDICWLIRQGPHVAFNAAEKKQWDSYIEELNNVFYFYLRDDQPR